MKITNWCILLLLSLTACTSSSSNESTVDPAEQKKLDAQIISTYVGNSGLKGKTTPSGMFYSIERQGDGPSAKDLTASSKVVTHYHGTFLDGKVFDSSVDKKKPFDFKLGQVIAGWQEAIKLLNQGGKGTFIIPSHLAYGTKGFPGAIPPNSVLRFEVELLEIY